MNFEVASDIVGLLSGVLLVITAVRADHVQSALQPLLRAISRGKNTAQVEQNAESVAGAIERDLQGWTWLDRWSLRGGMGLLLVSFFLKMIHHGCSC